MKKEFDNYNVVYFEKDGKRCIKAWSTFAGKKYWGISRCDPDDVYDEEKGLELAKARCNDKITAARERYAKKRYMENYSMYKAYERELTKSAAYVHSAKDERRDAEKRLKKAEKALR